MLLHVKDFFLIKRRLHTLSLKYVISLVKCFKCVVLSLRYLKVKCFITSFITTNNCDNFRLFKRLCQQCKEALQIH